VNVEFECVICGASAVAAVDDEADPTGRPLQTLRDCPDCGIETIWVES